MTTLASWDALQRHVGRVPRAAAGFTTNLFASAEQFDRWSAVAPLRGVDAPGAALILRADDAFVRVYHVAEDPAALTAALRALPAGTYVADLIGHGAALAAGCDAYRAAGFADHAFLRRMARSQPSAAATPASDEAAVVAGPADAPAVAALLRRLLDPLTEQLPTDRELAAAAGEGRLLVDRRAAPTGMLMFDRAGPVAHLRFWHVDPLVRGSGVGRRLMAGFLERCAQARRIVLWVIGDNLRSIAIYRHYGFAEDNLLDRIMVMHKDGHQ